MSVRYASLMFLFVGVVLVQLGCARRTGIAPYGYGQQCIPPPATGGYYVPGRPANDPYYQPNTGYNNQAPANYPPTLNTAPMNGQSNWQSPYGNGTINNNWVSPDNDPNAFRNGVQPASFEDDSALNSNGNNNSQNSPSSDWETDSRLVRIGTHLPYEGSHPVNNSGNVAHYDLQDPSVSFIPLNSNRPTGAPVYANGNAMANAAPGFFPVHVPPGTPIPAQSFPIDPAARLSVPSGYQQQIQTLPSSTSQGYLGQYAAAPAYVPTRTSTSTTIASQPGNPVFRY
jgi:hypothetical protein